MGPGERESGWWSWGRTDYIGATPLQKDHLPMTAFGSVPKAQMQGEPEGT